MIDSFDGIPFRRGSIGVFGAVVSEINGVAITEELIVGGSINKAVSIGISDCSADDSITIDVLAEG